MREPPLIKGRLYRWENTGTSTILIIKILRVDEFLNYDNYESLIIDVVAQSKDSFTFFKKGTIASLGIMGIDVTLALDPNDILKNIL